MSECNCTLRETAVGDGCRYCNPQFLIDHLADERDEQAVEIEQLQYRVKELRSQLEAGRECNYAKGARIIELEAENAELRESALELCSAVENEEEFPPVKFALRCLMLVNRIRKLAASQQADDEGEA